MSYSYETPLWLAPSHLVAAHPSLDKETPTMTFLELDSAETFDLALELYFAGDAPDLDSAAALAADLNTPLFSFASDWDMDCHEWELALAFAQTA